MNILYLTQLVIDKVLKNIRSFWTGYFRLRSLIFFTVIYEAE